MSPELLSLIAIIIALTLTVIVYILLRLKRHPEVIIYATHDLKRPAIINLVLENTGKDIAHNVRFECNKRIPARAFGFDDAPKPGYMTDGPLIHGISSFAPGEQRIITWGQYGGLKKGLGDDVLNVTTIYYSKPPLIFRRRRYKTTSRIDLLSVEGTGASETG